VIGTAAVPLVTNPFVPFTVKAIPLVVCPWTTVLVPPERFEVRLNVSLVAVRVKLTVVVAEAELLELVPLIVTAMLLAAAMLGRV
jgi:hypothetical protein